MERDFTTSWGGDNDDDDGTGSGEHDFETQLRALDSEREERLAEVLRKLDDRLYRGAEPDPTARIGNGHGTFSIAPPHAELEWRPLNCFVRRIPVGHPALQSQCQCISEEIHGSNPGLVDNSTASASSAAPTHGIARQDSDLKEDIIQCFKVYDARMGDLAPASSTTARNPSAPDSCN